jgi:hypothetical protein
MKSNGFNPASAPARAVDSAPGGPSLEGRSRPASLRSTLLGLGNIAQVLDGERSVRRPSAVWHRWLSKVGSRRERARDLAPPAGSAPIPREPTTAADVVVGPTDTVAWERLWLATQRRPWRSLAVISTGKGASMLGVARALAEVGSCHLGVPVMAVDATTITLATLEARMSAWIEPSQSSRRIVLAVGPVLESPASLALAQAADAAILCLTLGASSISEAERTIEQVGRGRLLGSVILPRTLEDR